MKKFILLVFSALALNALSQDDKSWRFGFQWGFHGNDAYLKGGDETANALFGTNNGGGSFNFVIRYDHDSHWMVTSGMGFQTFGFSFSLAQSYSLRNPNSRFYNTVQADVSALEIPVMLHYKFKPNCRNSKWIVGAGWVQGVIGRQAVSNTVTQGDEAATNTNYLTATNSVKDGYYSMLRFTIGRERLLRKGGIVNVAFVLNAGFRELASATVNYRVDGQEYHHVFGTTGSFAGVKFTYFLRPFPARHKINFNPK